MDAAISQSDGYARIWGDGKKFGKKGKIFSTMRRKSGERIVLIAN